MRWIRPIWVSFLLVFFLFLLLFFSSKTIFQAMIFLIFCFVTFSLFIPSICIWFCSVWNFYFWCFILKSFSSLFWFLHFVVDNISWIGLDYFLLWNIFWFLFLYIYKKVKSGNFLKKLKQVVGINTHFKCSNFGKLLCIY